MNHLPSLVGLTVAAALALPGVAGATTFCVNGPAGCDGTAVFGADLESKALQGAHRDDGAADLVVLAAGTYTNADTIEAVGDDPLEIRGAGKGSSVLTSGASSNIMVLRLNTVAGETILRDLTVAVPASLPDGLGGAISSGRGLFERVGVTSANPGSSGVTTNDPITLRAIDVKLLGNGTGVKVGYDGDTTLEDSVISAANGITNSLDSRPFTVRRTRFVSAGKATVAVSNTSATAAISDSTVELAGDGSGPQAAIGTDADDGVAATTTVDHVTIVHTGSSSAKSVAFDDYSAEGQPGSVMTTVTNSIVRSVATTARRDAGTTPAEGRVDLRLRSSNAADTVVAVGNGSVERGAGMIDADPLFGPGFTLGAGSPSIDAGDAAFAGGGTDVAGLPRVTDGNGDRTIVTDQGAHEYPGPTSYPAPASPDPAAVATQQPTVLPLPALQSAARFGRLRGASVVRRGRSYLVRTGVDTTCTDARGRCVAAVVATSSRRAIGRSSVSLASGRTAKLTVKLNRAAAKRLRRAKRLRMTLTVTVTKPGAAPATQTRTVTIRLPRKRR